MLPYFVHFPKQQEWSPVPCVRLIDAIAYVHECIMRANRAYSNLTETEDQILLVDEVGKSIVEWKFDHLYYKWSMHNINKKYLAKYKVMLLKRAIVNLQDGII